MARLEREELDVLVVGGGITGVGIALDAASRGLSVGLIEADDLAAGTSSRSSKLIHGGLRYLEMLEFRLVREALRERRLLLTRLAPHLVRPVQFLYPLTHRGLGASVCRCRSALLRHVGGSPSAARAASVTSRRPRGSPHASARLAGRGRPLPRRPGGRRPLRCVCGAHGRRPRRLHRDQDSRDELREGRERTDRRRTGRRLVSGSGRSSSALGIRFSPSAWPRTGCSSRQPAGRKRRCGLRKACT